MIDTKLIRLLKTFNKSEYKQLGEFLHSPFLEKNRHLNSLYTALQKFYPEFKSKSLTYEFIYGKIFPGEKYNYTRLNNIISLLYRSSEKFLAHLRLEKGQEEINLNILKELVERKLSGEFEKKYKKVREEYNEAHPIDESDFKIKLDKLRDDYISLTDPNTGFKTLQDRFDSYLTHALINLITYYTRMFHENRENNFDYDKKLLNEIVNYLEEKEIDDEMLKINYEILLLEIYKREEDFRVLRELVPSQKDRLPFELLNRLYLHLHGYCAWQAHANVSWEYYRESFVLIKEMVDVGIVNVDNTGYMDFLNVVKMGASQNEFEWVDWFIKEFSVALSNEMKDDIINFAYGNIEYVKKNFTKALDYFSKSNFKDFLMKVQVKILIIKMHYEAGNYDQMLSAVDSFRHYLKREKDITEDYKHSFKLFLSYTEELAKLKHGIVIDPLEKDFEMEKLTKKINAMDFNALGVKVWLQNKCRELKVVA